MSLLLSSFFAIAGAIIGSFVGVVAERVNTGQSWQRGRSRCNSCREPLAARDLVPVLSWTWYRGRCRQCRSRIPGAYVLYELALALVFAASYAMLGFTPALISFLAALVVLAFIVIYDLRHTIVPLTASSALIVLCGITAWLTAHSFHAFIVTLAYAGGVGLFFFSLYFLSRGRAMGLGDTPVAFALALLAGSQAIAGTLFSFWIGAVIGIYILVTRRGGPTMGIEVPFVPFMAAGFLLAIFTQWNPLPF